MKKVAGIGLNYFLIFSIFIFLSLSFVSAAIPEGNSKYCSDCNALIGDCTYNFCNSLTSQSIPNLGCTFISQGTNPYTGMAWGDCYDKKCNIDTDKKCLDKSHFAICADGINFLGNYPCPNSWQECKTNNCTGYQCVSGTICPAGQSNANSGCNVLCVNSYVCPNNMVCLPEHIKSGGCDSYSNCVVPINCPANTICNAGHTITAPDGTTGCDNHENCVQVCSGSSCGGTGSSTAVNVFIDPDYAKAQLAGRKFTPQGDPTPFDDIICEFKFDSSLNINSATAKIVTYSDSGIEQVIYQNQMTPGKNYNDGTKRLELKVKGWSNNIQGWTSDNAVMEQLVKTGKAKCIVTANDGKDYANEFKINTCLHLWGVDNSKFKVINMQGASTLESQKWLIQRGIDNYQKGFNYAEPFKTYQNDFSHYADLAIVNEGSWATIGLGSYPGAENQFYEQQYFDIVPKTSSCGSSGDFYIFYNLRAVAGYTQKGVKTIFLNYGEMSKLLQKSPQNNIRYPALGTLHEAGHSFAYLMDEYAFNLRKPFLVSPDLYSNCVSFWSSWEGYGDPINEKLDATSRNGCNKFENAYRPSFYGLMSSSNSQFNVIDCGFILERIEGSYSTDILPHYWERCLYMGGLIAPKGCKTVSDCEALGMNSGCSGCDLNTNVKTQLGGICRTTENIDCSVSGKPGTCFEGKCINKENFKCYDKYDCGYLGYDSDCIKCNSYNKCEYNTNATICVKSNKIGTCSSGICSVS